MSTGDDTKEAGPPRPFVASIVRVCAALGSVAAIATIAGGFADFHWACDLVLNLRIQLAVGLAAVCSVLAVARQWRIAALFTAFLVWNVVPLAHLCVGRAGDRAPVGGTERLTFVSVNVLTSNRDAESLRSYLRRQEADIVVVLEVDRFWEKELSELRDTYPHRLIQPRSDNFGIGLLSRWPLEEGRFEFLSDVGLPTVIARTRFAGRTLTVVGTHPLPPVGRTRSTRRNEQLSAVSRRVAELDGPVILAGDLNTTPWSPHFRRLVKQTNAIDARRGFGLQCSWPARNWPLSIPIDHILVSRDFHVHRFEAGPDVGSDHRPVCAELSWRVASQGNSSGRLGWTRTDSRSVITLRGRSALCLRRPDTD